MIGLSITGAADAAKINKSGNIFTSETWTADNVYNLTDQVYVLPGATLTIEAGTLIQSDTTANGAGSLAITKGAKIYALGTAENPIIMTSSNDDLKTWRPAASEWGNLTVLGDALISAYNTGGVVNVINDSGNIRANTCVPDGLNQSVMEGLTAAVAGDPRVLYGGDNDDDNSGAICYVSLRYGGRVTAVPGKELNGLSLGGIGRCTDIHHIDIMNNVDDGIEIWGGTVNLSYISIWNIGDDSFDLDQGWRGKAQFGCIVQGYSADDSQGSGLGDNVFEMDGAEDSDCQPVTTSTIYNFTVVGNPDSGDGATAWRDGARVQFRNCIFMDIGEEIVRLDNSDGAPDNHLGYGVNGTLPFFDAGNPDIWDTAAGTHSTVNDCGGCPVGAFNHPDTLYTVQTSGNLAEIVDSCFYNVGGDSGEKAIQVGVLLGTIASPADNPAKGNDVSATLPVQDVQRAPATSIGGKTVRRVTFLDPRPVGDAKTGGKPCIGDKFFKATNYCGGFSAKDNWMEGWTAAYHYGLTGVRGDEDNDNDNDLIDFSLSSSDWLVDLDS